MNFFVVLLFSLNLACAFGTSVNGRFENSFEDEGGSLEAKKSNNTLYLFPSRRGMFITKQNFGEFEAIVYDCFIQGKYEGDIDISDEAHPKSVHTLLIQNCQFINLEGSENTYTENIIIKNITFLNVYTKKLNNFFKIYLKDIKELTFKNRNNNNYYYNNNNNNDVYISSNFISLKNVVINHTDGLVFELLNNSNSILQLTDSYIGETTSNLFKGRVDQVKIFNTSFDNLKKYTFNLTTNSFVFSNNYIGNMENAFLIKSQNVEITGNTFGNTRNFDNLEMVFLSPDFSVFNFSKNTLQSIPYFLISNLRNIPSALTIENNKLTCDCRNYEIFEATSETLLQRIFFSELNNNYCHNLENCNVNKLKKKGLELCTNTFKCSDVKNTSNVSFSLEEQMKLIYSTIQEILQTLQSNNVTKS